MPPKMEFFYDFDFHLYGVVCHEKPYKLAWLLNQKFGWDLSRNDDLCLQFDSDKYLKLYQYKFGSETHLFQIVKNRGLDEGGGGKFLLEEAKIYDYFIFVREMIEVFDEAHFLSGLKNTPSIILATSLSPEEIEERENLIFED